MSAPTLSTLVKDLKELYPAEGYHYQGPTYYTLKLAWRKGFKRGDLIPSIEALNLALTLGALGFFANRRFYDYTTPQMFWLGPAHDALVKGKLYYAVGIHEKKEERV